MPTAARLWGRLWTWARQVPVNSQYSLSDHLSIFQPDLSVLVLRHPAHNLAALRERGLLDKGGAAEERLATLECDFRYLANLFDEVSSPAPSKHLPSSFAPSLFPATPCACAAGRGRSSCTRTSSLARTASRSRPLLTSACRVRPHRRHHRHHCLLLPWASSKRSSWRHGW